MSDTIDLVDRYIAAWNADDADQRQDLIASAWSETGRYLDPLMEGNGHAGIDAMVAAVQDRFPGHRFKRTSAVDAHNSVVRFAWSLGQEGCAPIVKGVDFGVLCQDGRLESITGFLDQLPG